VADRNKVVPFSIGADIESKNNDKDPLSYRLSLNINWEELIDQANILRESAKSLANGYDKAATIISEKRPGQVIGIDDEKALRAYKAMIEHYRHLEEGAETALKNLIEGKNKYG
jgi:hypothetical protein